MSAVANLSAPCIDVDAENRKEGAATALIDVSLCAHVHCT